MIDQAQSRIESILLVLAIAGLVGFGIGQGVGGAAGFFAGALVGWINYRLLRRTVARLGDPGAGARGARAGVFLVRYGTIGVLLYVMMKYFEISLLAALTGLFAPVAAALVAILIELTQTRK